MDSQARIIRTLTWAGSGVAFLAVSVAVVASILLYNQTINLLTNNLRERLLSISITEASALNATDLEALDSEADWVTPEWDRVVRSLKRAKDANPNIVFMYIFRKSKDDPAQMEFVADAESLYPYANTDNDPSNDVDANGDGKIEPEDADKLQWPGQPYPEAVDIPEAFQAYDGPITVRDLYSDAYGEVLTGYSPIRNASGSVVAILATDIKADDFLTVTRQTLYPFVIFIIGLIFIISILSATLILLWKRRTVTLANLKQELEVLNTQQESLLHFISHEIKGYLTKGQNAFAGIIEGDYGEVSNGVKELATGALQEMRSGVATVMDILDASNYKKGTMAFDRQPFDLKKTVLELCDDLRPAAERKGLQFEVQFAPSGEYVIVGDEAKIRRHVLRNIVENAIRYTPTGKVNIALARVGASVRFTVTDTGVGIAEEDKPRLFTQGGKGKDSIKVNVDSTGYGLFVAKMVVRAHSGTIAAHSDGPGKGATFMVDLPMVN